MILRTTASAALTAGLVLGGALGAHASDSEQIDTHTVEAETETNEITFPYSVELDGEMITFQDESEWLAFGQVTVELLDEVEAQTTESVRFLSVFEGTDPIDPIPEPQPEEPAPEPEPEPIDPIAPLPEPEPEPQPEPDPAPVPGPVTPGPSTPVPQPTPVPAPAPVPSGSGGGWGTPVRTASAHTPLAGSTPGAATHVAELAYTGNAGTLGLTAISLALLGGGGGLLLGGRFRKQHTEINN